ncbi:putative membrane protein [Streptacidiphilus sp. MAP12-20]|uniref:TMEM175 family protein n=1 Tax=Streptacidiphilus sp. MAP12-20 TaxID=3156299 RepID=UPI0035194D7B
MSDDHGHPRRFTRSETARAEAFSDGVFAIAVTILVLGLTDPPHKPGGLGRALLSQWPVYLGYLASFSYVAVIWLNHHQAFVRIRAMDRGLHAANLLLLLTSAALAFPTAVVSEALQRNVSGADARVAVALYGGIAAAMCGSWLLLYAQLGRHPELLDHAAESTYVAHGRLRSWFGAVAYLLAGAVGVLVSPLIALVVFMALPVFYFMTTEGLPGRPSTTPAGDPSPRAE